MKKKQTIGERIAGLPPRGSPLLRDMERVRLARRIDAAIRRAVREAWHEGHRTGFQASMKNTGAIRLAMQARIERKYGVKL